MKLVSLNLRFGGQNRTDSILNYLMDHDADLLVLGEYQDNKNGLKIKETLKKEGFTCKTSDDDLLGVLVASKYPYSLIMRERRLVGIELSDSKLTVLGVYVPTGSNDKRFKDAVWQKILKLAQENCKTPCIITGDFNSCTKNDSMNRSHYSADELEKLINMGWIDVWGYYNNTDSERYTWYSDYGNGFRFDYIFISPELAKNIDIKNVYHDSKKRGEGMSDHSPLILDFKF